MQWFPLAAVDAVAALAAVDAVIALAAVEAHPYRDGWLMEASQGEAVVARAGVSAEVVASPSGL